MRAWMFALALAATPIAAVLPAHAQESRSQVERIKAAAEEFDAGRHAFTAGDFDVAAEHFENADREAPAPEALRMAIRARISAKHYARAATLADAALTRYPDDAASVAFAKSTLAKVASKLHRVRVRCEPACTVLIDQKLAPGNEAEESLLYVEPGTHEIVAGWSEGRTKTETVEGEAKGQSELSFTAPPLPEPETPVEPPPLEDEPEADKPAPQSDKKPLPPLVFYGGLGLTTLLGGVTVWSTLDMRANPGKDKVREDCAGASESCPTYQDALSAQRRTNVLLISTGVVAVGTAVVGAVFTDWTDEAPPSREASKGVVVPSLAVGDGVMLGASGRF